VLSVGGGVAGYRALAGEGETPAARRPAPERAARADARREGELLRQKLVEAEKTIITLRKALEDAEARARLTPPPRGTRARGVRRRGAGREAIEAGAISSSVEVKQAELKVAQAELSRARSRLDRMAKLAKEGAVAKEVIEEAKLQAVKAQA